MSGGATLRLGSRGSRLALAQAELAAQALLRAGIAMTLEIVPIRTRGDDLSARRPSRSFLETDGQFTSDLEGLLVADEIDLAVHSLKDLPTESDPRLGIVAVIERDDPKDCLVTSGDLPWEELPFAARIGTGSPRRAAQLAGFRPDLIPLPIRGNVETRLARVRGNEIDGVVLAAAGLDRLGIAIPRTSRLPLELMLPAPGQGAIAIQCLRVHPAWNDAARADHAPTRLAVESERQLLRALGGGCLAPLGALGTVTNGELTLQAAYEDGDRRLRRASASGPAADPAAVVARVAAALSKHVGEAVQA